MSFLLKTDVEEIANSLGDLAHKFSGKRILITGGRGFLGRYFTEVFQWLNKYVFWDLNIPLCELIVLDNFITAGEKGRDVSNSKDVAFVEHDIIKPFYPERPVDYILHAAGIASPYYYRQYPLETLEVATIGLTNMLKLARRQDDVKLLFFSSSEIYGDPDANNVPTKETYLGNVSCLGARACYDESKRLGETLVRIFHEKDGVHATIVRPFNVYGPGMQKTDYRVLPNFGARVMGGKPLHIYGDGKQTRTFCYVTDAIRGFLQVLVHGKAGEPYNIGNPTPEVSMIELATRIIDTLDVDVSYDLVPYPDTYPADEPLRRCPDIGKAALLGYKPNVELAEGLKRFFGWAREAYTE